MNHARNEFTNELAEHEFDLGGRKKILIVDDNVSFLSFAKMSLDKTGALIQVIQDPYDAIKTFLNLKPNFVFLDVNMPGLSGFSLFKMMSEVNFFNSKIILVSANRHYANDLTSDSEIHPYAFLDKPVSPTVLRRIVMSRPE